MNPKRIPNNLTLHDLRHTTASILINKKLDPRAVSGVLGHANTHHIKYLRLLLPSK